jgi:hypothetical protein
VSPYSDIDEKDLIPRRRPNAYDPDLAKLQRDRKAWGVWKELDRFPVDGSKGKAAGFRTSLVLRWGPTPNIAGFEFRTAKTVDRRSEILMVKYDPELRVDGDWEGYLEMRDRERVEVNRVKKVQKEARMRAARLLVTTLKAEKGYIPDQYLKTTEIDDIEGDDADE